MRSKIPLLVGIFSLVGQIATAVTAGDKRTIFTSGEKVYPIHYQLGQSTVLYFGLRPETVICGNKNYFNIEKIKDAVTIQPLSSFSTNLTVIIGSRRYLFFLTPASGAKPDGFVEVRWIPADQASQIKNPTVTNGEVAREINQNMQVGGDIELRVRQEKSLDSGRRRIFELELKSKSKNSVPVRSIEVVAFKNNTPLERQIVIWEKDELVPQAILKGRLIISGYSEKLLIIAAGFRGKSAKLVLKAGKH